VNFVTLPGSSASSLSEDAAISLAVSTRGIFCRRPDTFGVAGTCIADGRTTTSKYHDAAMLASSAIRDHHHHHHHHHIIIITSSSSSTTNYVGGHDGANKRKHEDEAAQAQEHQAPRHYMNKRIIEAALSIEPAIESASCQCVLQPRQRHGTATARAGQQQHDTGFAHSRSNV
jgi:hypothetical protein